MISNVLERRSLAFLTSMVVVLVGCPSQAREDHSRPQIAATTRSGGSDIVVFEEAISPAEWLGVIDGIRPESIARLEFLNDNQQPVDLLAVPALPNLTRFRFDGPFPADQTSVISRFPNLRLLNLRSTELSDAQLIQVLGQANGLTTLRIGSSAIGDTAITQLPNLVPGLTHLHLIGATVSDRGVAAIAKLESLESFYMDDVRTSDEALRELVERRPDLHLHVNDLHIDERPPETKTSS